MSIGKLKVKKIDGVRANYKFCDFCNFGLGNVIQKYINQLIYENIIVKTRKNYKNINKIVILSQTVF